MKQELRVLVVDDSPDDVELIVRELKRGGYNLQFQAVSNEEDLRRAFLDSWDLLISDYSMPGFSGLDTLKMVSQLQLDLPTLLVSGVIGEETAVEAMKLGAKDYIMKNHLHRLLPAVARELQEKEIRLAHRAARIEVEQAEELRSLIIDTVPALMSYIDLEQRYVFVNETYEEWFGQRREQMIGLTLGEHLGDAAYQKIAPHISRALQGETVQFETALHFEGHSERWVFASFRPHFLKPKKLIGLVQLVWDISERKRNEEESKRRALELARSNKDLEAFAYIASHDLQEPLRMVSSYLQLLEKKCGGTLDEESKEFMGFAVEGAHRMQNMIRGILNYSRLGRGPEEPELVNCEELVRQVCQQTKSIEEKKARIEIASLPQVTGFRGLLMQVFQNLIDNAVKYQSDRVPEVKISAERYPSEWVFSIKDNGIGIEDSYLERIFTMFQRVHERGKYPGNGIGLASVRKIINLHGGRIWVESKPGIGSCFSFSIPLQLPDPSNRARRDGVKPE